MTKDNTIVSTVLWVAEDGSYGTGEVVVINQMTISQLSSLEKLFDSGDTDTLYQVVREFAITGKLAV